MFVLACLPALTLVETSYTGNRAEIDDWNTDDAIWSDSIAEEEVVNTNFHSVFRPPKSAKLQRLNADATAIAGSVAVSWPNAQTPALRALQVLQNYLDLSLAPPPIVYVSAMEDNIVGKYYFTEPIRIEVTNWLSDAQEFYVTLHELLHFAGFGTLHGIPDVSTLLENWDREFESTMQPVYDTHWTNVSNSVHRRTGSPAQAELMTETLSGQLFLSATTLLACTRGGIINNKACIDAEDCAQGNVCSYPYSNLPGLCAANGTTIDNDLISSNKGNNNDWEIATIVVLSVLVVFVAALVLR